MENPQLVSLDYKLSEFVKEVCRDRDESHGHEHAKKVAISSIQIFLNTFGDILPGPRLIHLALAKLTLITAWLHDIDDAKYQNDKSESVRLQMKDFLLNELSVNGNDVDLVFKITKYISYSAEVKLQQDQGGRRIDFDALLGAKGGMIRNIVSDADKLEALGNIGLQRCIEYTRHAYFSKHNSEIPLDVLKQMVKQHADEKLLKLSTQFMRTNYGKRLAEPLHQELENSLQQFLLH